jgi:hypothetical protein
MELDPMTTFVTRADRLAAREVAGEMVILAADDSSFFVLNETGTSIWRAADGRTSLEQIAARLCDEFEVDFDTAIRDVDQFARALADAGVIALSAQAAE